MNSDYKEFRPITDLEGRVPSIVLIPQANSSGFQIQVVY